MRVKPLTTNPFCIHRLVFNSNKKKGSFDKVFKAADPDTIAFGNSHLIQSLSIMTAPSNELHLSRAYNFTNYKNQMLVLIGDRDVVDEYYTYIIPLLENKIELDDYPYLIENRTGTVDINGQLTPITDTPHVVDVWWDYENNVMFCFSVKTAEVVMKSLKERRC